MNKPPPPLNTIQIEVAKSYANGDFRDIVESDDWRRYLTTCGDTLFSFLMMEFSPGEDCENVETALARLQRAADDIEIVFDHLAALAEVMSRPITQTTTSAGGPHELER